MIFLTKIKFFKAADDFLLFPSVKNFPAIGTNEILLFIVSPTDDLRLKEPSYSLQMNLPVAGHSPNPPLPNAKDDVHMMSSWWSASPQGGGALWGQGHKLWPLL